MDRIMMGVYAVGALLGTVGSLVGAGMLWGALQNVTGDTDD